jgi:hypothetical protein
MHRVADRLSTEERRLNESGKEPDRGEMSDGTLRIMSFMWAASTATLVWALQEKLAADRPGLKRTRDAAEVLLKSITDNRDTILFGIRASHYGGTAKTAEERLGSITNELISLQDICDGLGFYYPVGGDALPANNKKTFCIRYVKWEVFGSDLDLRDQDIADTVGVVTGLVVTADDVRKAWRSATAYMRRPSDIPM